MVFFVFIEVFYFIFVSSLSVHLYDYSSSAENFCSKSVSPGSVLIKNLLKSEIHRVFFGFTSFVM